MVGSSVVHTTARFRGTVRGCSSALSATNRFEHLPASLGLIVVLGLWVATRISCPLRPRMGAERVLGRSIRPRHPRDMQAMLHNTLHMPQLRVTRSLRLLWRTSLPSVPKTRRRKTVLQCNMCCLLLPDCRAKLLQPDRLMTICPVMTRPTKKSSATRRLIPQCRKHRQRFYKLNSFWVRPRLLLHNTGVSLPSWSQNFKMVFVNPSGRMCNAAMSCQSCLTKPSPPYSRRIKLNLGPTMAVTCGCHS